MRVYLDANVIIYLIEAGPPLRTAVLGWLDKAEADPEGLVITSYLSQVECRVKPLREGQDERLRAFDGFFASDRLLVADVTRATLDQAVILAARYGFKTPDAIHLATAVQHQATVFLTADDVFRRFTDLRVELIDPSLQ